MDGNAGRPTDEDRARRRVELKVGLAVHWVGYLTVSAGVVLAADGVQGSWWRPAGWGLDLAGHTGDVLSEVGRLQQRPVEGERARERVR